MQKTTRIAVCLIVAGIMMSGVAQAHLVTFGWQDLGNGTVRLWGEHWHGDQAVASTANGGIHITPPVGPMFTAQWFGVQNNIDRTAATFQAAGDPPAPLTGWTGAVGNAGSGIYDDWFYTVPLVIGDGTWTFFTGINCCIDTMNNPVQVTLSGITSVPPGTGPGATVPEPATLLLFGSGLALVGLRLRKRRQA